MRLLRLEPEGVQKLLDEMEKECKEIKKNALSLSWYMRGGVTINDLLHVYSHEDRDMIYNVINDNIELTKETRMPLL